MTPIVGLQKRLCGGDLPLWRSSKRGIIGNEGAALSNQLTWRESTDSLSWDRALAALGGHPLQSALWGDARRILDGIIDRRFVAVRDGEPVSLVRIEQRPIFGGRWVGWTPRGPAGETTELSDLSAGLRDRLRRDGMCLFVTDRWAAPKFDHPSARSAPRTIWIDLSVGIEKLAQNLDKQWRYGVGRAQRLGVTVDSRSDANDIARFFALCTAVAENKGFALRTSVALMERLLDQSGRDVEARLFLARFQGSIVAGAFVIRCGRSLHYIWGATDRAAANARAGEAVQWAAIEWGVASGCKRYDLEGIDPVRNAGTHAFKMKMGGSEVVLVGKRYYPLAYYGRVFAWLDARRG